MATRRLRSGIASSTARRRRRIVRRALHQRLFAAFILGNPGEHAAERGQWLADMHSTTIDPEFSNRPLMAPASLFHRGDRLSYRAGVLEIAQQDDGICEIADLGRFLDRPAEDPALDERQNAGHVVIREVTEELVHLNREKFLRWHGLEIAIDRIDHDHSNAI